MLCEAGKGTYPSETVSSRVDLWHGGLDLLDRNYHPVETFTAWFADMRYTIRDAFRRLYGKVSASVIVRFDVCHAQRHLRWAVKSYRRWVAESIGATEQNRKLVAQWRGEINCGWRLTVADAPNYLPHQPRHKKYENIQIVRWTIPDDDDKIDPTRWHWDPCSSRLTRGAASLLQSDYQLLSEWMLPRAGGAVWQNIIGKSSGHANSTVSSGGVDAGQSTGDSSAKQPAAYPFWWEAPDAPQGVITPDALSLAYTAGRRGHRSLRPAAVALLAPILGPDAQIVCVTNCYFVVDNESVVAVAILTQRELVVISQAVITADRDLVIAYSKSNYRCRLLKQFSEESEIVAMAAAAGASKKSSNDERNRDAAKKLFRRYILRNVKKSIRQEDEAQAIAEAEAEAERTALFLFWYSFRQWLCSKKDVEAVKSSEKKNGSIDLVHVQPAPLLAEQQPAVWRLPLAWLVGAYHRQFRHQPAALELKLECRSSWLLVLLDTQLTISSDARKEFGTSLQTVAPWVTCVTERTSSDWLAAMQRRWSLRQMSTYSYLMNVNMTASRSGVDLAQFPIMPWVLGLGDDILKAHDEPAQIAVLKETEQHFEVSQKVPPSAVEETADRSNKYADSQMYDVAEQKTEIENDEAAPSEITQIPTPSTPRRTSLKQKGLGSLTTMPHRDLSIPIGSTNANRREEMLMRFAEWCDDDPMPPFHHGTHYSTSAIVLWFLVRLYPFANLAARYQGSKLDKPDRLFHSIVEAYKSSTGSRAGDCKELIPECFMLPEIFLNCNRIDMGIRQSDNVRLDDALLPSWAGNNPHKFIVCHRAALESESVAEYLPLWLDLIFGCRQQGESAVNSLNVYHHLTYAYGLNAALLAADSEESRKAVIGQVEDFGVTPPQVFGGDGVVATGHHHENATQPHPSRTDAPTLMEGLSFITKISDIAIGMDHIFFAVADALLKKKKVLAPEKMSPDGETDDDEWDDCDSVAFDQLAQLESVPQQLQIMLSFAFSGIDVWAYNMPHLKPLQQQSSFQKSAPQSVGVSNASGTRSKSPTLQNQPQSQSRNRPLPRSSSVSRQRSDGYSEGGASSVSSCQGSRPASPWRTPAPSGESSSMSTFSTFLPILPVIRRGGQPSENFLEQAVVNLRELGAVSSSTSSAAAQKKSGGDVLINRSIKQHMTSVCPLIAVSTPRCQFAVGRAVYCNLDFLHSQCQKHPGGGPAHDSHPSVGYGCCFQWSGNYSITVTDAVSPAHANPVSNGHHFTSFQGVGYVDQPPTMQTASDVVGAGGVERVHQDRTPHIRQSPSTSSMHDLQHSNTRRVSSIESRSAGEQQRERVDALPNLDVYGQGYVTALCASVSGNVVCVGTALGVIFVLVRSGHGTQFQLRSILRPEPKYLSHQEKEENSVPPNMLNPLASESDQRFAVAESRCCTSTVFSKMQPQEHGEESNTPNVCKGVTKMSLLGNNLLIAVHGSRKLSVWHVTVQQQEFTYQWSVPPPSSPTRGDATQDEIITSFAINQTLMDDHCCGMLFVSTQERIFMLSRTGRCLAIGHNSPSELGVTVRTPGKKKAIQMQLPIMI